LIGRLGVTEGGKERSMNEPAARTVAEELRRMIVTGEVDAGSPLSESCLSDALKCSPASLGDAIHQMCQEHLVVALPGRGFVIPALSAADFHQLAEAQLSMTTMWVVLAAERTQTRHLDQMRATLSRQESAIEALDLYSLVDNDRRFHILLAEATGNSYFTDAGTRLHGRLSLYAYQAYKATEGSIAGQAVPGHRAIMEALEKGDPALAEERVRTHIGEGKGAIPSILRLGAETEES